MAIGLRHLRVFLAVVDQGSVSQAAATLYRAQSAVSRSVRELEKEFGVPLFERRAQGMLPTRFGDALQHRARRVAAEFDAAGRDSERLPGSKTRGGQAPTLAMQLSDRRLRAFVELAAVHHMPTVAEKLGVSQPAISLAIRELETALGLELFARTPKGMLPTAQGGALASRVKRAMAEVRHARADIARLCGRIEGTITVGALPLGRTVLLPRAIAQLLPAYPGLHVATVEGPFDTLAAALRSGDVDFILGALRHPGLATDFAGEALLADELAIVARADHPLCTRRRVTWRELARAQWVLPRKGARRATSSSPSRAPRHRVGGRAGRDQRSRPARRAAEERPHHRDLAAAAPLRAAAGDGRAAAARAAGVVSEMASPDARVTSRRRVPPC